MNDAVARFQTLVRSTAFKIGEDSDMAIYMGESQPGIEHSEDFREGIDRTIRAIAYVLTGPKYDLVELIDDLDWYVNRIDTSKGVESERVMGPFASEADAHTVRPKAADWGSTEIFYVSAERKTHHDQE